MKYNECSIRRKGRQDGRNFTWKFWPITHEKKEPVPPKDQKEIAAFENVLFNFTSNDLGKISEQWSKVDEGLKPNVEKAYVALMNAEERYKKEKNEADAVEDDYQKAKQDYFNIPVPSFSPTLATLLLIFIAIGEFPLNSMVFQLFGENKSLTYIIAALICVSIPLAAHFFGMSLKNVKKSLTDIILISSLPILILLEIGAIAWIREKYFEAMMLNNVANLKISSEQLTIIFVIINLAIFFIATFISYSSSYENNQEYRSMKKLYTRIKKRYDKEYKEEAEANLQLERNEKQFKHLKQQREKRFEQFQSKASQLIKVFEGYIWCYRDSNINVRYMTGKPACFDIKIVLPEMPASLVKLDNDFQEKFTTEGSKASTITSPKI
jgi:hypothetical protein